MAILVSCQCGQQFLTADANAGRAARCLQCGRRLTVSLEPVRDDEPAWNLASVAPPFSGQAVLSLLFGVMTFFLLFLAGIPAIAFGISAIGDINRSRGRIRGAWLAMAGIALGVVGSTLYTGIIASALWLSLATTNHQAKCSNNVKEIMLAIHNYYSAYSTFPREAIFDRSGRPLLSWRVAILPYLGPEAAALYQKFHLKERWDSPHNRTLIAQMPAVYRCKGDTDTRLGVTPYQLLTGPGTVFDGREVIGWPDFVNSSKISPILLVEADSSVPWTAPIDITYDPNEPVSLQKGDNHSGNFQVANWNGSVSVHEWTANDSPPATPPPSPPAKKTPAKR